MRVASCSYEGSIFGWNVEEDKGGEGLELPMSFGFSCSQGALKTLAVSSGGQYLSCGGSDERIHIFNVAENKSMGELGLHEGAITALDFFDDSYMISGSEDTTLRIWRCHDWECVHVLSGHKEAITSVAIHPSGKLALSVSKDNTLKLWNLVQGRCSFTRRLRGAAEKVLWNPSGEYYLLTVQMEVQIYRASDNVCTATIKHPTRVNKAVFVNCGLETSSTSAASEDAASVLRVACVCENRILLLYKFDGTQTARMDVAGLDGRPRDMWSCKLSMTGKDIVGGDGVGGSSILSVLQEEGDCLVIATSLGRISIISCRSLEGGGSLEECTLVSTQVKMEPRLTGVVAWNTATPLTLKEMKDNKESSNSVLNVPSKKRPRDSSSAAADIVSSKAFEKEQLERKDKENIAARKKSEKEKEKADEKVSDKKVKKDKRSDKDKRPDKDRRSDKRSDVKGAKKRR